MRLSMSPPTSSHAYQIKEVRNLFEPSGVVHILIRGLIFQRDVTGPAVGGLSG